MWDAKGAELALRLRTRRSIRSYIETFPTRETLVHIIFIRKVEALFSV